MPTLLLASHNPGKLAEFQALLVDLPAELLVPRAAGLDLQVPEEGSTYGENAAHKALAFARASGALTLADDSGLEVDVLGGQPGLHSARYSPLPEATDCDRRQLLLQRLSARPRPWRARFVCVIAIAEPSGRVYCAEGQCSGEIISEERGRGGFGYDPLFLLPSLGRTMAELTAQEKNRLSHRARAVQAALPMLVPLLDL